MAEACGFHSVQHTLDETTSESDLLGLVQRLNADPAIHGILVQSPPPPHIDERAIVEAIDPRKDVDGFHPISVAKLALGDAAVHVVLTRGAVAVEIAEELQRVAVGGPLGGRES